MRSIQGDGGLSRREWLRLMAGGLVAGPLLGVSWSQEEGPAYRAATVPEDPEPVQGSASRNGNRPWWLGPEYERSRVVQVRADNTLNGTIPDPYVVDDLVGQGVEALAAETSPARAWRKLLGDARRIVLKFDIKAAKLLNTTDALARVLVEQLAEAGYHPRTLHLVHVPNYLERALETSPVDRGWGEPLQIGDRLEPVANYLYECDALINIPSLMAHPVGGMACGIHSLGYGLLKHPGRYYKDNGYRLIPELLTHRAVSDKLRLTIVNALRVIVAGGADATENEVSPFGGLLLGFDPVAVDSLALEVLARERRRLGHEGTPDAPYINRAVALEVGRRQVNEVEHQLIGPTRG